MNLIEKNNDNNLSELENAHHYGGWGERKWGIQISTTMVFILEIRSQMYLFQMSEQAQTVIRNMKHITLHLNVQDSHSPMD